MNRLIRMLLVVAAPTLCGVLEGKEVHAFSPSSITVVEGDTLHLTLINPEDDDHSFVLPDFAVAMPPQKTTEATYVATHAGLYAFLTR